VQPLVGEVGDIDIFAVAAIGDAFLHAAQLHFARIATTGPDPT
jgi:hypothetical protein